MFSGVAPSASFIDIGCLGKTGCPLQWKVEVLVVWDMLALKFMWEISKRQLNISDWSLGQKSG